MSKRRAAARVLRGSGVGPVLLRRGRWRGVLVLTYHRILDAPPAGRFDGVWSATPEDFARQMDLVARTCDVVALEDVPRLHDARGRYVAITFDDGYRDNHQCALPVLRERGLPATLFLASGLVDGVALAWWDELAWLHGGLDGAARARFGSAEDLVRRSWTAGVQGTEELVAAVAAASDRPRLTPGDVRDEWMSWDEVRELRAGGVEIEAHTSTHPLLVHLDEDAQRAEIAAGVERIAAQTGRRPTALAYPVGVPESFDERSKRAARAVGLTAAYGLYGGPTTASAPHWDPYDVRRIGIGAGHGLGDFAALLAAPRVFGDRPPVTRAAPLPGAPSVEGVAHGNGFAWPRTVAGPPVRRGPSRGRDGRIATVTLVDRLIHGGAERMAFLLTRELDRDRFAPVLCVTNADDPRHASPGTEPAAWREELLDAGVRLVELRRERRSDPRGWGPLLRELRRADVLHAHMFTPNVQAAVLGSALRVPVTIGHEHAWSHTGGRHQALVDRRVTSRGCDVLIACSSVVRDRMLDDGVAPDRVVVLPNGIEGRRPTPGRDVRAELGIAPGVPVVGSVGALRDVKRFDVLVDAAALLRRHRPDVQVLIVGDGDERAALEERVRQAGLGGVVRFLGARSDVPDVVATFDVAVLTSDAEASPLSVLEYMDAGRAIVATAVGGVPELLETGVHGRLVPRRDPGALAAAVLALVADPDERRRLGAAAQARRRVEFGLDVMVSRLEHLYEDRLARTRTRAG